jgi:predicted AAA+ superfamily ATPase
MDKDIVKILISEYQSKAVEISLVERNFKLEDAINYVFVGLRRVGKSYLMFQQIRHLLKAGHKKDEILYFNFEDERISSLNVGDLDIIKQCFEEMFNCKPIFFLDEIQVVDHWEKFARRLSDQGYRVYITGSNAKMLSSEIATTLGGRYITANVYPFSFSEHLLSAGINISKKNSVYQFRSEILKAFEIYFRFGGLPELIHISDKRSWLSSLYQKVFFGDLIARHQIRNDFALRILIQKLAENVKQPTSFNRLANIVSSCGKKISTDTVIDYLGYLKDTWLIFPVENYCAKISEKESTKKYYFIDNGLINLFLIDPLTSLLENQVAVQLRRLYGDDVYFYRDNVEVDFYIPQMQMAVQACYRLQDDETRLRETKALIKLSQKIDVNQMLIITKDEEYDIVENGKTIKVIPLWKWLLVQN